MQQQTAAHQKKIQRERSRSVRPAPERRSGSGSRNRQAREAATAARSGNTASARKIPAGDTKPAAARIDRQPASPPRQKLTAARSSTPRARRGVRIRSSSAAAAPAKQPRSRPQYKHGAGQPGGSVHERHRRQSRCRQNSGRNEQDAGPGADGLRRFPAQEKRGQKTGSQCREDIARGPRIQRKLQRPELKAGAEQGHDHAHSEQTEHREAHVRRLRSMPAPGIDEHLCILSTPLVVSAAYLGRISSPAGADSQPMRVASKKAANTDLDSVKSMIESCIARFSRAGAG